jgi:hypothetical protein
MDMPFSHAYAMSCIDIRSFVDGFYSFIEGVPNTRATDVLLSSVCPQFCLCSPAEFRR